MPSNCTKHPLPLTLKQQVAIAVAAPDPRREGSKARLPPGDSDDIQVARRVLVKLQNIVIHEARHVASGKIDIEESNDAADACGDAHTLDWTGAGRLMQQLKFERDGSTKCVDCKAKITQLCGNEHQLTFDRWYDRWFHFETNLRICCLKCNRGQTDKTGGNRTCPYCHQTSPASKWRDEE